MFDEELHAAVSDFEWILTLADLDHEYPERINAHSHLNALAAIAGFYRELAWREKRGVSKKQSNLGWDKAFIDQLKARVPVEREIGRTITLKRRGTSMVGNCPFHDDNSPSLVVWPDSGRWRCFGCGIHGDVITWTQAIAEMPFVESIRYLAAIADIDLPARSILKSGQQIVPIGDSHAK